MSQELITKEELFEFIRENACLNSKTHKKSVDEMINNTIELNKVKEGLNQKCSLYEKNCLTISSQVKTTLTIMQKDIENISKNLDSFMKDNKEWMKTEANRHEELAKERVKEKEQLEKELNEKFVTKAEFSPIKKFIYATIGIVVSAAFYLIWESAKSNIK